MIRFIKVTLAIAVLFFCVLANPSVLWAATTQPEIELSIVSESAASSGIDADTIPSEKLNQFVQACLQVVALIERREGELQSAETDSESVRIQQDIEAEAIAIIEENGLTRQEYLQLLSLANVDPDFGERIATLLQETPS